MRTLLEKHWDAPRVISTKILELKVSTCLPTVNWERPLFQADGDLTSFNGTPDKKLPIETGIYNRQWSYWSCWDHVRLFLFSICPTPAGHSSCCEVDREGDIF